MRRRAINAGLRHVILATHIPRHYVTPPTTLPCHRVSRLLCQVTRTPVSPATPSVVRNVRWNGCRLPPAVYSLVYVIIEWN